MDTGTVIILLGANAAHAEVTDRDHGVGADQTLGNFLARHLQREEADGTESRAKSHVRST